MNHLVVVKFINKKKKGKKDFANIEVNGFFTSMDKLEEAAKEAFRQSPYYEKCKNDDFEVML